MACMHVANCGSFSLIFDSLTLIACCLAQQLLVAGKVANADRSHDDDDNFPIPASRLCRLAQ
jgi:hypothetical protein